MIQTIHIFLDEFATLLTDIRLRATQNILKLNVDKTNIIDLASRPKKTKKKYQHHILQNLSLT